MVRERRYRREGEGAEAAVFRWLADALRGDRDLALAKPVVTRNYNHAQLASANRPVLFGDVRLRLEAAMFKKEWEPARGTIVASKYFAPTHTYDFVIDVQPAGGAPVFRATCSTPPYAMARIKLPYVGDVVPVLCDAKRRKVKIDLDDPALQLFPGVKGTVEADRANFDAALKGAPGSTPPGAPPTPSGAAPAASRSSHGGVVDELAKLADLRDRGALTDAEFEAQKVKLLSDS